MNILNKPIMETSVQKKPYPTVAQSFRLLLKFYLLAVAYNILFGAIAYLSGKYPDMNSSVVAPSTLLVTYVVSFLTIIYLGISRFRATNEIDYRLNFNSVPIGILLLGSLVVVAAGIIIDPVVALIPGPKSFAKMFASSIRPDTISFLSVVVAAPVAEEIFFRGIILEGFLKNYSPKKAIVWSALVFGAYHLNPWQAISATVGGLIIGWICWRTKSLVPGIFLHALNNATAFFLLYLSGNNADSTSLLKFGRVSYALLIAASLLVVFVGSNLLNKRLKSFTPNARRSMSLQIV